jgi:hypothetical protein
MEKESRQKVAQITILSVIDTSPYLYVCVTVLATYFLMLCPLLLFFVTAKTFFIQKKAILITIQTNRK